MTKWLHASLIAVSIAIDADHAGAATLDPSTRQNAAVESAPRPALADAWKKALVYLALLGAATYGARLYKTYTDEVDDPA